MDGDYNEASTFLSYFASEGLNYGGWSNSDYDQALQQASVAKSDKERAELYQKRNKCLPMICRQFRSISIPALC